MAILLSMIKQGKFFCLKQQTVVNSNLSPQKEQKDIQYTKASTLLQMKLSTVWDNIRQMNSTIEIKMNLYSNITQKCLFHSSGVIKTTGFYGITTHIANGVTLANMHKCMRHSIYMIRKGNLEP